ncbi:MAG TPA: hypothetical protein VFQ85_12620 [Mycobacteriales bacterium]|jgi:hypothetical protein|nr:hypothetical protein [Mycobacteriales bacterium]
MPPAVVLCVYRARNARVVRRLVRQAVTSGAEVRLWALDEVVPSLAAVTVGSGPGGKFALADRLLAAAPVPRDAWVVVADDDVRLPLKRFLALAGRAAFDLSMPAHLRHRSNLSHAITLRARWSLARVTEFVEIGPVFAVSPAWRDEVLPFGDVGMGWGLEADWYGLSRRGARLGIVDAAPCRHLAPVAASYEQGEERDRMAARLAANGLGGLHEVQRTLATWRPWQRTPPWLRRQPT